MRPQKYTPLFSELPTTRQERWNRLAQFASFWHGIDCPAIDYTRPVLQTETRLHINLPNALIEWHMRFGRFINLWSDRAFTFPINRLHVDGGTLIVRSESVFNGMLKAKWGIPISELELEDPRVVSILGEKTRPCANSVSEFAIYCALFDTINARHTKDIAIDNDTPFPSDGKKAYFPPSFGIIKTEMYEGTNWIALVSGTDWYLRQHDPDSRTDQFIRHELRTKDLPP